MEEAGLLWERGEFELPPVDEAGQPLSPADEAAVANEQAERRREEIRSRHTRRMHDLSKFMKSLLERFTKWFNRTHSRSGHLPTLAGGEQERRCDPGMLRADRRATALPAWPPRNLEMREFH
jgi:hypothetical protein